MKSIFNLSFFLFSLLSFLANSQGFVHSKAIDSLITVTNEIPNDSLKVANLHALFDYLIYKDAIKAKQYADEEIRVSELINYETGIANGWYNYGVYYNTVDKMDSARIYYQKSYDLFNKKNNDGGKYSSSYGLAILELNYGNHDKALAITEKNIDLYKNKIKDSVRLALQYDFISGIYSAKGSYQLAFLNNLKAVRIFEKTDKKIRLADALSHLADTELDLEDFDKSLEHKLKAYKIYIDNKDQYYATFALNDIGNTYYYLKDYNKSIEYLNQGLDLAEELKLIDIKKTILNNLGKTYSETNNFNEAFESIRKALKIADETENDFAKIEILNNLGILYNNMKKPGEALTSFNEAITLGDEFKDPAALQISYFNRSEAYSNVKQPALALKDFKQYTSIKDSLYGIKKLKQIEELRTIYETEKKEQQIAQQETEIVLLEEQEKVSSLQKMILGGGLGLSLLTLGFGFYGIRQKMKRTKIEKEKINAELQLKESELAFKKKELTTHAMHLAKKNEVLEQVKQKAKELKSSQNIEKGYQQLVQTINFDQQDDKNWESFTQYFEQVHRDFSKIVKEKYPEITKNELRLMALLKMNLSTKEIAIILNISVAGVKKARNRLRKKLGITPEESLETLILSI